MIHLSLPGHIPVVVCQRVESDEFCLLEGQGSLSLEMPAVPTRNSAKPILPALVSAVALSFPYSRIEYARISRI